ncbi:CsgG/HfaB family protein [uncultured Desulfobacter sp.]|uniref:CsgG/HfaB family protein n=1 Tax=uncultured Desulfobacter sp. TaxID=240139 RepID=UPI0029F4D9A7|nr:CsgG/HfaB family protein [uncultured Desulfobacter sp.]
MIMHLKYSQLKTTLLIIGLLVTALGLDGIISPVKAQESSWLKSVTSIFTSDEKSTSTPATIAILSHTDFLPDATAVYDKRRMVGLPEILADAILEQLAKSKRLTPVERKALRTAIIEQRFGKNISKSYMDRTLDKAIQDMDQFEIGGGLSMGPATAGAGYNDLIHDFKDLGSAVGANFLILGNLHQLESSSLSQKIPFSDNGKKITKKTTEARLRLRIIDTSSSTVIGADSLHLKVSETLFRAGKESHNDFEFMNQVALEAANKILDIIFPAKIVSLEPLVISRGINDGVKVGDKFTILREGQEIKEDSGVAIARLKSEIGVVEASDVQETVSIVNITAGANFLAGDLAVRVASKPGKAIATQGRPLSKASASDPGNGQKPRVAIGLVKAGSTAKTGSDADKHTPMFTDSLITRLVQSKRFTIIDRQEVDQFLNEQLAQAIVEDKAMPTAMGTLKGCDYLVIGSLQNFSIKEQTFKLPNSSRVITVLDGFAEGNIRLVDARSGDIIESQKITVKKQLERQAGQNRLITSLADDFAAQIAANLLNAVYPIKIAAMDNETIYINRGLDGLLQTGSTFAVMRPGQKILDPDTGVELGTTENKIAEVELLQVDKNRSLAKILEGSDLQSGDVLKLVTNGTAPPTTSKGGYSGNTLGNNTKTSASSAKTGQIDGKATLALSKITLNTRKKVTNNSIIYAVQEGTMDQLTDILTDNLARTNRFVMMERREVDQIIDEKAFQVVATSGDIRDYLQQLQGADYLVVGELTNFYLHIERKKVPYLDEVQVHYTGFMEGNIRIVDSHTSAIAASDKIRLKRRFKNIGIEEIRTSMIDQYAIEAANGIVKYIYPMKVLGVLPDGTIFINRGADAAIKAGMTFSLQRPGQALIDKDTGVSFGVAETTIGTVKITMVEAARSRAQLITGEAPLAGDILRNQKKTAKKKKKKIKVSW